MTLEPEGTAQIHVVHHAEAERYDLRYYGSDEFVVPLWWIGITNPAGELVQTDVYPGAHQSPDDVRGWLRQIVGADLSDLLVREARVAAALTKRETAVAS